MPRLLLRATLSLTLLGVLLGGARPAAANPTQLCRAFTSIALAPTDLIFAPYISARDAYGAVTAAGEPYKAFISFPPAYPLFLVIQAGGTVLRVVSGAFEILPGLVGLAFTKPSPPLFRAQDEARQIYSGELGPCPLRVGTSYWGILAGSS
jgi:hypothetical protein